MSERSETLLQVPADLVKHGYGLALDIGGTALKFIFRTKGDVDEVVQNSGKLGRMRMVTFERKELSEGLKYLRQKAYLPREGDEQPKLYTTGVGCTTFGKAICEALDVSLENLTEYDCFVQSFIYLADHLPRHDLLIPFLNDALTEPIEQIDGQMKFFKSVQELNLSEGIASLQLPTVEQLFLITGRHAAATVDVQVEQALSVAEPDTYPCVLAVCGSGFVYIKVNEDRTFKVLDGSNRSGKGFYGVGKLLTGCRSFNELVKLASRGDTHNVDQYSDQLHEAHQSAAAADGDDSVYSLTQSKQGRPGLVYCFGRVASAEEDTSSRFSREDIAASWLHWVVLDLVQSIAYCCRNNDVKRVFFCGGFCQEDLIRRYITTEMARRNMFASTVLQQSGIVTFDFVSPGSYLGALGCLVKGLPTHKS